jgi:hypothetical protein
MVIARPERQKKLATPLHEADVTKHGLVNYALEKRKSVIKTLSKTRLYGL